MPNVAQISSTDASFPALLSRIRGGDQTAAYELVQRYALSVRVAVRTRLSDPALRRQFDSMDICQSVLASFFLRAAVGQYDLDNPRQLVALLIKMAENKLAMHSRRHFRQRRNAHRTRSLAEAGQVPSREIDPGRRAADRDLLRQAYDLMGPEVREMAKLRMAGGQWDEIAAKLGGTPEGRRKQYRRAIKRISRRIDLD